MRRRQSDPTLFLGIFTVILLIGAVGAFVAHRSIQPQLGVYRADPHCRTMLVSVDTTDDACVIYRSTVAQRWSRYSGRTRYYSVAVAGPNGSVDSLDLVGSHKQTAWNAASPGTPVVVERFTADGSRPHITAIELNGKRYQTLLNPEYRASGDIFAIILFVLAVPVFAWLTRRSSKQRRVREMIVQNSYRATIKFR